MAKARPPAERFWPKVQKTETCWLWTASRYPPGYGRFWDGERPSYAHRIAYELLVGPIPEGLTLDHLCRVPACVKAIPDELSPAHLEVVTHRENILRSPIAPAAINARKTHCPQGHPYDKANTYRRREGGRLCRICVLSRQHEYRGYAYRRKLVPGGPWILKTHCPRGHAYDGMNVYQRRDGGRRCRACERLRDRIRRAA